MSLIPKILPLSNVVVDLDASSKKRVFEQAGLLFENNQDIARSLHLAEGTVKSSIASILDQLGSRDRTRAVLKAINLRII